jgi:hypothetical protein
MEQISAIRCPFVELKNCRMLMRSRKTLPKLAWSRYGASVLSVTALDDQLAFYPTTLLKSGIQSKRAFGHVKQYVYYVLDDYLYIPDVYIEAVNVVALALDRDEAECRKGCGCADRCKSYWEYEFVCPDKLSEFVIRETLQEVLGGRMQIPVDENPNMDSNLKTRTGQ